MGGRVVALAPKGWGRKVRASSETVVGNPHPRHVGGGRTSATETSLRSLARRVKRGKLHGKQGQAIFF